MMLCLSVIGCFASLIGMIAAFVEGNTDAVIAWLSSALWSGSCVANDLTQRIPRHDR